MESSGQAGRRSDLLVSRRFRHASTPGRSGGRRDLLLFAALCLLLAWKGDGHFPLPRATAEPLFQLYILALTLAFVAGLLLLLRPAAAGAAALAATAAPLLATAAGLAATFALLDGVVLWLEARHYAGFGYELLPLAAAAACLLPACLLAAMAAIAAIAPAAPPRALLAVACCAHLGLTLYAIAAFPLAPGRSDMLPLLMAAGRRLLAGHDPYAEYVLAAGSVVPLTYLPGMLLAYLPAALLAIDPRWLGAAYTLGAALLLYLRDGRTAPLYLAVFVLSPYLIYRHDLYLAPALLLLALAWTLLVRGRGAALAGCCGALAATSQLLAIPAAATVLFVARRNRALDREAGSGASVENRRSHATLRFVAIAAAVWAAALAPFMLADPGAFARGTFSHWTEARDLQSFNLAYWLLALLPPPAVRALQAAAVAWILFQRPRQKPRPAADPPLANDTAGGFALPTPGSSSHRLPWIDPARPQSVFAVSALAVTAFAALNTVVWTYFYLLVLFLALLAKLPAGAGGAPPTQTLPAR